MSTNELAREVFRKLKIEPFIRSGYVAVEITIYDVDTIVKDILAAPLNDLPINIPYEKSISSPERVLRVIDSNPVKLEYYWLA